MANKLIQLAKVNFYFKKSESNQNSLNYVYELCFDGKYYYIYRTYYKSGKLISVNNYGVSKNREIMVKKYKELTNMVLNAL